MSRSLTTIPPSTFNEVQGYTRIFLHRFQHFARLVSGSFQRSAGDMSLIDITRHTNNHSPGIGAPVGGK